MKKIVSLLAVALFATTFAAGCGKPTKCSDAKKEEDCKKAAFFDDKEGDKGNCHWVKNATDATKGTCEVKPAAPDLTADTKLCEAAKADKKTCDDESANLANKATHECKFTAETAAGKADQKCEINKK